jgi:hypothetical protein
MTDARIAFAQALSEELGVDMNDEFLAATDRVLARLYLFGFIIRPPLDDGGEAR